MNLVQAWLNAGADREDRQTPILLRVKNIFMENERGNKSEVPERGLSATLPILPVLPSASAKIRPPLIPLESPWRNGARYREAGCTEIRNRLACYIEDEAGPWVRRHGVLIACTTSTPAP